MPMPVVDESQVQLLRWRPVERAFLLVRANNDPVSLLFGQVLRSLERDQP